MKASASVSATASASAGSGSGFGFMATLAKATVAREKLRFRIGICWGTVRTDPPTERPMKFMGHLSGQLGARSS